MFPKLPAGPISGLRMILCNRQEICWNHPKRRPVRWFPVLPTAETQFPLQAARAQGFCFEDDMSIFPETWPPIEISYPWRSCIPRKYQIISDPIKGMCIKNLQMMRAAGGHCSISPDFASKNHAKNQAAMVDSFQDSSGVHWGLIKKMIVQEPQPILELTLRMSLRNYSNRFWIVCA